MRAVASAPHGLEALAQVVRYTLLVSEHVAPAEFAALLEREIGPEARETVMTIGEQLIQQGIERGKLEGERAFLLKLIRLRFGDVVDEQTGLRIARASSEQLETWGERILSAASLSELLGD
ncbi:MAG TPA: DUF4351 domain-containing protein [Kofleriaceae bacterium]|nr:DUF4351 domain-containing protein [Kofleriaceae bacterium]